MTALELVKEIHWNEATKRWEYEDNSVALKPEEGATADFNHIHCQRCSLRLDLDNFNQCKDFAVHCGMCFTRHVWDPEILGFVAIWHNKVGESNKKFQYNSDGTTFFWCPGCEMPHCFKASWSRTGTGDEPTFRPSLVSRIDEKRVCHLFVEKGKIRFLPDSWHKLAGQTIEVPEKI